MEAQPLSGFREPEAAVAMVLESGIIVTVESQDSAVNFREFSSV